MSRRYAVLRPLVCGSVFLVLTIVWSAAPRAACSPTATAEDDDIVCTDTVTSLGVDPEPQTTVVDGGDGNDTISNDGDIVGVAVSLLGATKETSDDGEDEWVGAQVTGIQGGSGDDTVTNTGSVSSNAVSNATNAGIGIGGFVFDIGATTSSAEATGIDGGDNDDTLGNSGDVTATATAVVESVAITGNLGISSDDPAAYATSKSVGIDGGDGQDTLTNTGNVTTVSTSVVGAQSSAVSGGVNALAPRFGKANENKAEAEATGLSGGNGADTLNNEGNVSAIATAVSGSSAVDIRTAGGSKAISTSTAETTATGIDAGDGDDTFTNTGNITAVASSVAAGQSAAVSKKGKNPLSRASWGGGATAEATANGIETGKGVDNIDNDAAVTAVASAVSGTSAAGVSAEGTASADSTSKAEASGTAINAGADNDTVDNSGDLTVVSTATAGAADLAFSYKGTAKAEQKGGATAEATAIGISGDGTDSEESTDKTFQLLPFDLNTGIRTEKTAPTGDDTISNDGAITAVATAVGGSGSVAISVKGAASADAKSKAEAKATAIDAGGGDDTVTNTGDLTAVSTATAGTLGVGVSEGEKSDVKAGATAEAEAFGIRGDGTEASSVKEASLKLSLPEIDARFSIEKTGATGDDTISNSGAITAVSTAVSGAGTVAVSVKKAGSADATSKATSLAVGIEAGSGDDSVTNSGAVTSVATSTAGTIGVAFSESEKGSAKAGATAESEAIGIRGDGSEASSLTSGELVIRPLELTLNSELLNQKTASSGNDTINNDSAVTAVSTAVSGAGTVAVSVKKAAAADATSTAKAKATGIEAGAGDDTVTNSGAVTAISTATAGTIGLAFSESDRGSAKAGATAEAEAFGIRGDGVDDSTDNVAWLDIDPLSLGTGFRLEKSESTGADTIVNSGAVTAVATAVSGSATVGISVKKAAAADAKSTAKANAVGIEAGAGDDSVTNSGAITAASSAVAGTVGFSFSESEKSEAKSGATAEAEAVGIKGDGSSASYLTEGTLNIGLDGLNTGIRHEKTASTGNDTITNDGAVTAVATAVSGSGSAAVSIKKAAEANATSTAKARAAGIDAGAGDDTIDNHGAITAVATSVAGSVGLSVTDSKDSSANADATAESTATGISGDGELASYGFEAALTANILGLDGVIRFEHTAASGDDTINNDAAVTSVATAVSGSGSVAVSISGAASADASSKAKATALGIDAGGGNDTVDNSGAVTAVATATSGAFTAAIAGKGNATGLKSIWSGGSSADANATGISGDSASHDFSTESTVDLDLLELRATAAHDTSYTQAGGDDTITNDGVVTATAVSISPSIDVSVALDGMSGAVSTAEAESDATGIDAGTGDDTVTNSGTVVATSVATAAAVNVAVSKGAAVSADALWDGSTSAESEAVGIAGDGEGRDWNASGSIVADLDGVRLDAHLSSTVVSGDDVIDNEGTVVATSVAAAPVLGVAISVDSVGAAMSSAEAESRAAGIDAGAGDDTVTSSGEVVSTSVATAAAVNIAASKSSAIAGNMLWDGNTQATSEAVGISGDGEGRDWNADGSVEVTLDAVTLDASLSTTMAGGNDDITNDGTVVASSVALVPSIGVAVSIDGAAGAVTTAAAESRAAAIDAGTGDDTVMNRGELVASSLAIAGDVNVAVSKDIALADNSLFDGGTTSTSDAVGISGDGEGRDWQALGSIEVTDEAVRLGTDLSSTVVSGDDTLTNEGTIVASSVALTPSASVAVAVNGVSAATSTATADSRAAGIDAGAGNDTVNNQGDIVASSLATAVAANIAVAKGAALATGAAFDGGTVAQSEAVGISGDGEGRDWQALGSIEVTDEAVRLGGELSSTTVSGDDEITNDGTIVASSVAIAPAIDVAVALQGVAAAASKATAEARALGIDAGAGNDTVTNTGKIVATAAANADAISVSVTPSGVAFAGGAFWDGATTASSEATGISGDGEGRDWQASGTIEVTDEAVSLGTDLSSTVAGGDDTISNEGTIVATSVSLAPSLGVSVAVSGVAGTVSTSSADATAIGIDAGTGDDTVTSSGGIVATSVANADAISIAVTPAGLAVATDSLWDGGTTATSEAIGISGDGEGRDWHAEGGIEVTEDAVRLGGRLSTTEVSGDDTITNDGSITATSVAVSVSAGVSVALEGVAAAGSTATADSRSAAIDAGAGDDIVDNSGTLVSTSVANANAIAVAVTPAGVAGAAPATWDGGTTATSEAVGISGDGQGRDWLAEGSIEVTEDSTELGTRLSSTVVSGNDTIDNDATIVASSAAAAPSIGVSVAVAGVAGSVSTATADSRSMAIDGGSGDDTITNSGTLVSTSLANADALSVAVTPAGVALVADAIWDGGTEATSEAIGISGDGEGRDWLAEGGIYASDDTTRIDGLLSTTTVSGDDKITNTGDIVASSVALAPSVGVSVAVFGVAGAVSQAGAESSATAIDAGSGNDFVDNSGDLVSTSVANADAVSIAVSVGGVAFAAGSIFEGGTVASSEAIGISGDGEGRDWLATGLIESTPEQLQLGAHLSSTVAGGNDTIINSGSIISTSAAAALSVDVPVAVFGVAGAITEAQADSRSVAIDAGTADDIVINSGQLVSTSVAAALTVPAAISVGGVAMAGNDFWAGGTEAISEAIGISGDGEGRDWLAETSVIMRAEDSFRSSELSISRTGGDDIISNDGKVVATSVAEVPSVSVSVAVIGAAASISSAEADSRAVAIDAGVGDDYVANHGELVATSVANANTVNVSVAPAGLAVATDAIWDGGTDASSEAIGISADGSGQDESIEEIINVNDDTIEIGAVLSRNTASGADVITNDSKITATSVAVAPSVSVAVSVAGVSAAATTATADATAAAIDAGAGDDTIINDGELIATSVANADAIAASVALAGVAGAANAFWDGGTEAIAQATGISADGAGLDESITATIEAGDGEVHLATVLAQDAASGDDDIDNTGNITSTAVAVAPSITATVTAVGVGAAVSTATSDATALAIDAGAGNDTVTNSGTLTATAVSNADGIRTSTTLVGVAAAADSVWDGGTTATAEAIGIGGDGVSRNDELIAEIDVVDGDVHLGTTFNSTAAAGNDNITNTGSINATTVVVAPSITQSTTIAGASAALSTATAEARSIAIDAGAGDDTVANSGALNAVAVSNADAISISLNALGVSVAADRVWDGGATATANAIGIAGDRADSNTSTVTSIDVADGTVRTGVLTIEEEVSGNDIIDNDATIEATAVAVAPSIGIASTALGVSAAISSSTAESRAAAIDAGGGDDTVTNDGALTATSFANADAVSVTATLAGLTAAGTAAWDGGASANAEAVGISGDGRSTHTSTDHYIEMSSDGVSILQETVRENVGGNDVITNTGSIVADADAVGISADVSLAGVGLAAAVSTSEANARAIAIDGGGGADTIDNSGDLVADADATAVSVAVSIAPIGLAVAADAVWDGGTTAEAEAVGISGDSDSENVTTLEGIVIAGGDIELVDETGSEAAGADDTIDNSGTMTITADASSTSVGVSATALGVSTSIMTGTARTHVSGIDAGGGGDTVTNDGEITAISSATANTVAASVTPVGGVFAADAFWDGGTTAEADANGIDGGTGDDSITNNAQVGVWSEASTTSTGVAASAIGAAGVLTAATADAEATAIRGGDGVDTITNNAFLISQADANAVGTSVAVDIVGFAGTDTSADATATAIGIDGGAGNDVINNASTIWSTANATGTAAEVAVTVVGAAVGLTPMEGDTRADSYAIGMAGSDGDDALTNDGAIVLDSDAQTSATGVSVTIAGYHRADVSTAVAANGAGMTGGGGADELTNNGLITADVTGQALATAVPVGVAGASSTDLSTEATATVTGMAGDDNDDVLINRGTIDLASTARAPATSVTVQVIGGAGADISSSAKAEAIGMSGGQGNDELINAGNISLRSGAETPATGVTVNLIGAGSTTAGAQAVASATGMAGDGGADVIVNVGSIDITSLEPFPPSINFSAASAPVSSTTVNLFGAAGQVTAAASEARVTGIDGGAGDDFVGNTGTIDIWSVASASVSGSTFTLAGAGSAQGTATATAHATGLAGGSGADLLYNEGGIDVVAASTLNSSGSVGALFGVAGSDARIRGALFGSGMSGGDDDDEIINIGTIDVDGAMNGYVSESSWTLAGSAATTVGMTSATYLDGLSGGAGNDLLYNEGSVLVTSNSVANLTNSSWVLAGRAADSGTFSAFGSATGLLGGSGTDTIINNGLVDVDVLTSLSAVGGTDAIFGEAGAAAALMAESVAVGIDGGDDDDVILNLDEIDVYSNSHIYSDSTSFTFIGGSSATASLWAGNDAWGILGGAGMDDIVNDGSLTVNASATLLTPAESRATIGSASSVLSSAATAFASGIDGGTGPDRILNDGILTVIARSSPVSTGGATAVVGTASSTLAATASATANGIDGDLGDDLVFNRDTVIVNAFASPTSSNDVGTNGFLAGNAARSAAFASTSATVVALDEGANTLVNQGWLTGFSGGTATAHSIASGDLLITLSAAAYAQTYASILSANAVGVSGNNGVNQVINEGTLSVTAAPRSQSIATADGDGLAYGRGTAFANAHADGAEVRGIELGDGDNIVRNSNTIDVTASPLATAHAIADADGVEFFDIPVATSTAWVTANNALAVGVEVGHGDNEILNEGSLTVTASPRAVEAESDATAGPGEIAIDSFAVSKAWADNAKAYGIRTGNGDNTLWNTGSISVYSLPTASANAYAHGVGVLLIHGDARATASAQNALAVGIQTGAGDDVIYNDGSIYVQANPTATPTAYGLVTTWPIGNTCAANTCVSSATPLTGNIQAIGIATGAGDDVVWNAGTITTVVGTSTGPVVRVGVDLGAGDDALILLDGSQIFGSVLGGTESDSLLVDGSASINGLASGFETLTLFGTSSLDITGLGSVQDLQVDDGALNVTLPYFMSSTGDFRTTVNGNGSHGRLNAGPFSALNGNLTVTQGQGVFVNGTTYDIVAAPILLGGFSGMNLPTPTALLSFGTQQSMDRFQVVANVASFSSVAPTNIADQAFATQLDGILPAAVGDLEALLIKMQSMPSGADVEGVLEDLNPANYTALTESALATVDTYLAGVDHRLASLRYGNHNQPFHGRGRLFVYAESEGVDIRPGYPTGTWSAIFTQPSELGGLSGNHGLVGTTTEVIGGLDFGISDSTVVGAAFGSALTLGAFDTVGPITETVIDGYLLSLYGAHRLGDAGFLNAQMTYGDHSFSGVRSMTDESGRAYLQDSRTLAAKVEAGRVFGRDNGYTEAFASIGYRALREGGFDEVGGRGLNLFIDDRTAHSLETELGVRIRRFFDTSAGRVQPRFEIAWVRDFHAGNNVMAASFADVPDYRFTIPVGDRSQNALRIGGAIDLLTFSDFQVSASFESDLRHGDDRRTAKLEFRRIF